MKQKKFWLKLIGTTVLLHVILIVLSIIEVAIYSYFINPGQEKEVYTTHATISGPWISGIFGSLLIFFLVKRYLKRFTQQQLTYTIGLPAIYIVIDLILLIVSGFQFEDFAYQFVLAMVPKLVAALLAYFIYSRVNRYGVKLQRPR